MVELIKREGATAVKLIVVDNVVVDERVRLKCQVPLCPDFGRALMCPPGLPSLAEFRQVLEKYRQALLIQVASRVSTLPPQDHQAVYAPARELHRLVNLVESKAFSMGLRFAAGFIGGSCRLCDTCVGVGSVEPCRHPFKARPSMEAMGIDVVATVERAGMPVTFPVTDHVVWTGLVLLR
ncbi:hypothetical protein SY88_08495 [Clostridiales bacterium PH28_bin88]|nr:hypothetical protein SY88_08495 [Clostridiales bacterium PH28_bin88]